MLSYQITCKIVPAKIIEMEQLRDAHLKYIESRSKDISFGGLLVDQQHSLMAIVYYVLLPNSADAFMFAEGDPYFPFYKAIEVNEFIQKKP